ncbi:DinB family protein [Mucilaginibacter sp. SG564]|uniref:DinB family protein n=1 Tax=Mucilaginibacter sp. SG564 TaxID=2587022 RepID=UPI001554989D|nr:DinB family protein [Mucilaginibacter sp. SG564]NOW98393.1 hypothetical protein [Mucilaginibacter sp. SG564]
MITTITTALENTRQDLLHTISGFTQEQFNSIPFKNSWTAGQVAEHIVKFSSGGAEILEAPGTDTQRNPEEKVEPLRDLFLNFDIKMTAPDFIQPSSTPKDKGAILRSLENGFDPMISLSKTTDLTLTYPDFELPQYGTLTRLEWLYFICFHTQRHIHQMKNIRKYLN